MVTAFRVALLSVVAGITPITGTIAVTEGADTSTASGTVTPPSFTGTIAVTEGADTSTASGTVTAPGVTGTIAVTEGADVSAASGTVTAVPTVILLDTFTGSNGTEIVAHYGDTDHAWEWVSIPSGMTAPGVTISSNALTSAYTYGSEFRPQMFRCKRRISSADYSVTTFITNGASGFAANWPAIRMADVAYNNTAASGYYVTSSVSGPNTTIKIARYSATTLGSITLATSNFASASFEATLSGTGSTIALAIQRTSDSNWLTSGGTWQAGQTTCISLTDTTYTASGFGGITCTRDIGGAIPTITSWNLKSTGSLNAVSFTVPTTTPTPVTANSGSYDLDLVGINTAWIEGVTSFTVSGVSGVSILTSYVGSPDTAYLTIQVGTTTGTLTISDGINSTTLAIGASNDRTGTIAVTEGPDVSAASGTVLIPVYSGSVQGRFFTQALSGSFR